MSKKLKLTPLLNIDFCRAGFHTGETLR